MRRFLFPAFFLWALAASAAQPPGGDYRAAMRSFVIRLSRHAKLKKPGFLVFGQNGLPLLTRGGEPDGEPVTGYAKALDGVAQESVFYGHGRGKTPEGESRRLRAYLDLARRLGLAVLVADYPSGAGQEEASRRRNEEKGYRSFAGGRELDSIPPAPAARAPERTFLYLLNPRRFPDRAAYLRALAEAPHGMLVLDAYHGERMLERGEVDALRARPGGGRRPVLAYLSIGEAETYREYWKAEFKARPPAWLEGENPEWAGNYKVRYWEPAWQAIVFGSPGAYLDRILAAGFDGVYLDILDAFEHFEEKARAQGAR